MQPHPDLPHQHPPKRYSRLGVESLNYLYVQNQQENMALHEPSSPVHQAAKDGDTAVLSKASKKELNLQDGDGWTAVHWCAWSGHPEPLEIVLNRG